MINDYMLMGLFKVFMMLMLHVIAFTTLAI